MELLESLRAVPCGYHHYYYQKDEQLAQGIALPVEDLAMLKALGEDLK